jgi:hypothetical protein
VDKCMRDVVLWTAHRCILRYAATWGEEAAEGARKLLSKGELPILWPSSSIGLNAWRYRQGMPLLDPAEGLEASEP